MGNWQTLSGFHLIFAPMYKQLTKQDADTLKALVGDSNWYEPSHELFENYTHDHTEDLTFIPDLVLRPNTSETIAQILSYCNEHRIPVTPRGAGTGLSGGALPVAKGIVLSTEKLNRILEIDVNNLQVTVEPGVINEALQQELATHGLYYPPDPASKGSCFLGGNVAHASGGPKAVKYGTTRDYVLNLEVVLPNGTIIWTGANTLKYSTGYNLTHLMIGSEGTLGIITKIVFKVIALPAYNMLMLASFTSASDACRAVSALFRAGCTPSVCEFVEPIAFALSAQLTGLTFDQHPNTKAYLLIEVDGNEMAQLEKETESIYNVLDDHGCTDMLLSESEEKKNYFWRLRRSIGEATKRDNVYKEEDTVVPRASLPELFEGVKEIAQRYGLRTVCYGHAGDGNLHVNILKDQLSDEYWNTEVKEAIRAIFHLCKKLKGTISGEHGIGYVQKEYMPILFPEFQLQLMKQIKLAFDPNEILNPGKIW